jgi:hypothetical protein
VRYQTAGRPRTIILSLALILASIATPHVRAASPVDGLWDAVVVSNNVEIPFRFEIATQGTTVTGSFFEGDRKVGSSSGTFTDGALTLEYDFLKHDSRSQARPTIS